MGQMLSEPNKEFVGSDNGLGPGGLKWGVSSIQGWRTEMEDQHTVVPELPGLEGHSLFAVFDGHGGRAAALFASSHLLEIFQRTAAYRAYMESRDATDMGSALRQAFLDVDENMRTHFRMQANPGERSGCTAIAVCVTPTHVVTANAGDSRALLARRGSNMPLSFDHKPWLAEEQTRIELAGGRVQMKRVDGELAVSRALGDFQYKPASMPPVKCKVTGNPDIKIVEKEATGDEFLVLACDGIWDVMSNEEVIESVTRYAVVHGEESPQLMAEELIEECLSKGSRDNMSALIVLFPAGVKLVTKGKAGIKDLRFRRQEEEQSNATANR